MEKLFPFVLFAFVVNIAFSQSPHKQLRNGDLYYDQGEYLEAEEAYRKANAEKQNAQAQYNLGNSIYLQERYDEAVQHYESAAQQSTDPLLKAQAYHNLGNTHYRAQSLDKSIEAYRNSLKLNPGDIDTKKNLTMALQQLRQQQQQQQQDQQKGDQEKEEQQQEEQQQPQEQQQQQQQQQQDSENKEQPQPSESNEDLTKEEAEELLRIINSEDSKVQEKLRKTSANPKKPKKDW